MTAEQTLNATAIGATNVTIKQGITISNIASCLLGNSAINTAISQLSTALSSTTTQTATSSLFDSTSAMAAIACCVICCFVLSSGTYAYRESQSSPSSFRSIGNNRFQSRGFCGGKINRFNNLMTGSTRFRSMPYARHL